VAATVALSASSRGMTTDIDICRSAKVLIDQHGDSAAIHAAIRADQMLKQGDLDGRNVWVRIIEAIHELRDVKSYGMKH
jgi:hypothetical protein